MKKLFKFILILCLSFFILWIVFWGGVIGVGIGLIADNLDINIKKAKTEKLYAPHEICEISLDSLILIKVNEYRDFLNLSKLVIKDNLQKGAQHHSNYLHEANLDTLFYIRDKVLDLKLWPRQQSEIKLIRGHEEIDFSFYKRADKYDIAKENVMTVFGTLEASYENYATVIVEAWKESPPHHQTMIDPKLKYCGINSKIFMIYQQTYTTVNKHENKTEYIDNTMSNVYIVSTMTFK